MVRIQSVFFDSLTLQNHPFILRSVVNFKLIANSLVHHTSRLFIDDMLAGGASLISRLLYTADDAASLVVLPFHNRRLVPKDKLLSTEQPSRTYS